MIVILKGLLMNRILVFLSILCVAIWLTSQSHVELDLDNLDLANEGWILFECREPSEDHISFIYIVNENGTSQKVLTSRTYTFHSPTWSPNGQSVAYIKNDRIGIFELGLDIHDTLFANGNYTHPSWSPDGQQLVFAFNPPDGSGWNLYRQSINNDRGFVKLTTRIHSLYPVWSPTNDWIAYVHDQSIFLVRPDGTDDHSLIFTGLPNPSPAWSPDGSYLVFVRRESGTDKLVIMNILTGAEENILIQLDHVTTPAWSSDGEWIAFSAVDDNNPSNIYKIKKDGTNLVQLTDLRTCLASEPDWSPEIKK
jgi:TolB protein